MDQVSSENRFQRDSWLSRLIETPTYNLVNPNSELDAKMYPDDWGFISTKIGVDCVEVGKHLQDLGFRLVDTNIRLRLDRTRSASTGIKSVRLAENSDRQAVEDLAYSAFRYDRFHADPQISNRFASRVKKNWVGNYFSGDRGSQMVVAEGQNGTVGFLLLGEGNDGAWLIDLIAVSEESRGQGIAKQMICFVIETCLPSSSELLVGTQIANHDSVFLYQSIGFILVSASYCFHHHRHPS